MPAGPGLLVLWYDRDSIATEEGYDALAAELVDLRARLVALGREDVIVAAIRRDQGVEALDEGAMLVAGWRKVRPPRADAADQV